MFKGGYFWDTFMTKLDLRNAFSALVTALLPTLPFLYLSVYQFVKFGRFNYCHCCYFASLRAHIIDGPLRRVPRHLPHRGRGRGWRVRPCALEGKLRAAVHSEPGLRGGHHQGPGAPQPARLHRHVHRVRGVLDNMCHGGLLPAQTGVIITILQKNNICKSVQVVTISVHSFVHLFVRS